MRPVKEDELSAERLQRLGRLIIGQDISRFRAARLVAFGLAKREGKDAIVGQPTPPARSQLKDNENEG